jgi:hypothetical protein
MSKLKEYYNSDEYNKGWRYVVWFDGYTNKKEKK